MATVTEHPKPSAALKPRRSRRWRLPFSAWHLLLLPTAVVFALPLVQMVMTSLMSDREINRFPPRFFPSHISLGTGGTATLTFASGNAATFAYTVGTVTQSKQITRQLFAPPAGTLCQ